MNGSPSERLVETAHRLRVRYDVGPESGLSRDGKILQVGFRLDLYGRDGAAPRSPGDERCRRIYRGLREIALGIEPKVGNGCRFEIGGFEGKLYYDLGHGEPEAEVCLGIGILRRTPFETSMDPEQGRLLKEAEQRLRDLGIGRTAPR